MKAKILKLPDYYKMYKTFLLGYVDVLDNYKKKTPKVLLFFSTCFLFFAWQHMETWIFATFSEKVQVLRSPNNFSKANRYVCTDYCVNLNW